MDNEICIAESERQLNDTSSYKKLENDPKQKSNKLVNDTIERFKNDILITKNIAKKRLQSTQERQSFMWHQKFIKNTIHADQSSVQ